MSDARQLGASLHGSWGVTSGLDRLASVSAQFDRHDVEYIELILNSTHDAITAHAWPRSARYTEVYCAEIHALLIVDLPEPGIGCLGYIIATRRSKGGYHEHERSLEWY